MKNTRETSKRVDNKRGFTLIEMLVAIAIIAIVAAIATPSIIQWRQGLYFRQATRDVASMLRDARARSIAKNLQHRVVFDLNGTPNPQDSYMLDIGNLPVGSAVWTPVKSFVQVPQGVIIAQNAAGAGCVGAVGADINIMFNPNGTAINSIVANSPIPICIQDTNSVSIYQVTVNPITGGVTMSQRLN